MTVDATQGSVRDRLIQATVTLLADQGPEAVKARSVAAATGLSTMVVYHHFGGVPELMRAVADHGFAQLDTAFSSLPVTDDPVADLAVMALTTRDLARANPHLYDLMFGLSTRATYRPPPGAEAVLSGHSPAFRTAYTHVTQACERLVETGRVRALEPDLIAAQLWSFVHGCVTLELAQHFAELDDPVTQVLLPTGVNLIVGMGDKRERAEASHQEAASRHQARPTRRTTSSKAGRTKKATNKAPTKPKAKRASS